MGAADPIVVKCCLCRSAVHVPSGWCENCQTWPINITPIRFCGYAHRVNPDGWCPTCQDYVLTCLEPRDAQWIDTGVVPKRLAKEKIRKLVAEVAETLSGPGWPEKEVPLRRDMIPRRWKRIPLKVVGQTPLGHDIVLPASVPHEEEVPF